MDLPFSREALLGAVYYGSIAVVVVLEVAWPRRRNKHSTTVRWPNNYAIGWLNLWLENWALGLLGLSASLYAQEHDTGLLSQMDLPLLPLVIASVLILDLLAYWLHRALHACGPLWRVHAVHHSDLDFDFSTSFRRHPLEVLGVAAVTVPAILLIGVPPFALLVFMLLRASVLVFEHGNLRLPPGLDRMMRRVIVTPDVHRIHHSAWQPETDSNFGDLLTWWDRLFGTFREHPRGGHEAVTIGVGAHADPGILWLHRMLWQPFSEARPEQGAGERPPPANPCSPTAASRSDGERVIGSSPGPTSRLTR